MHESIVWQYPLLSFYIFLHWIKIDQKLSKMNNQNQSMTVYEFFFKKLSEFISVPPKLAEITGGVFN